MSDEFGSPGPTFRDGSDPRWTDLHNNIYTNNTQHFYSCDNDYTKNDGDLVILTEAADNDIIGFDEDTKKAFVIKSTSDPT